MAHDHAMATTELWWTFRRSSKAFGKAEQFRDQGKGRRPSERTLERLMKRQGLAFGSWQDAERTLEQLASRARKPVSIGDLAAAKKKAQA